VGHLTEDDLMDPAGEDRMVKALNSKEGEQFANVWDLARYYTRVLIEDWQHLNLLEPTVRPRATEHMREQIQAVQTLIESGHAYETSQGIYFAVDSFPGYGALSGNTDAQELEQTVRDVVTDSDKRDPRDFAIWKKDAAHLMQWHSPWGWGFPGWHIECSVMSMSYLGDEIDIHAGGEDLIFPHHECEIAQSESLTGKTFARHWVHTRFLQVEGKKMSKSAGNFFTVRDLIASESNGGKGIDPLAVRLTLLSGHYRKPFNFTFETLKVNIRHVERFRAAWKKVTETSDNRAEGAPAGESEGDFFGDDLTALYDRILGAMADDLNTPEAIAATLEGVKLILSAPDALNPESASTAANWLENVNKLLGVVFADYDFTIDDDERSAESAVDTTVDALVQERTEARAARDFARADTIRDELTSMGVELMDTPDGVQWKRRSDLN
jgi:cysteinyl-tRNA synthetase